MIYLAFLIKNWLIEYVQFWYRKVFFLEQGFEPVFFHISEKTEYNFIIIMKIKDWYHI